MARLICVSSLVAALAVAQAGATTISADGVFHEFVALDLGGPVVACGPVLCSTSTTTVNPGATTTTVPPWTFTGPANLLVIDLFLSGDRFEVFDNNVSLGLTSAPVGEFQCGTTTVADIGCAIADPRFSRGQYALGPGNHSITIIYNTTTSVLHTGAALQLTDVPEPATAALFLFGAGIVLAARRQRQLLR